MLVAALLGMGLSGCDTKAGDIDDARMRRADEEPQNWLLHGGNLEGQRFSRLDQINDRTVKDLAPAWVFEFDTSRGQESTPIVVDGVMYVTTAMSKVYALDAATGALLWSYDPKVPGDQTFKTCCDVINRGAAVYKGRVYVATVDGRLVALDAATGTETWSVATVEADTMYTISGAPRVVQDMVIIGNSGGDFGVRGYVSAYDAASGRLAWRFYLAPGDPGKGPDHAASDDVMESLMRPTWAGDKYWVYGGGANAWNDIAYDPDLDLLYIGTGNGSPWNRKYRSDGQGDNLFVASIVALHARTGKYAWHYQENPGECWDYTSAQPMILADLPIDGTPRKVLLHAPKNGFFYVLDRSNGKVISAESYMPPTWATGIDKATGRPIEVAGLRYEDAPFTVVAAAHSWHPFAFSPRTGLVYFPASAWGIELRQPEHFEFVEGVPFHAADSRLLIPLLPPPPRGSTTGSGQDFLLAWDPVGQKEAWRVPQKGFGVLATAGNLVFQGRGRDSVMGELIAFAADSGRELWRHDTPNSILPGPVTYSVADRQYVATVGGARIFAGAGPSRVPQHGRVVAFALGGTAAMPPDPALAPPIHPPEGTWPEAVVAEGQQQYRRVCQRCHGFNAASPNVIPDLRRSSLLGDGAAWKQVVIDGVLASRGMIGWGKVITPEQAEAVRGFVVAQARKAVAPGVKSAPTPPASP